MSDVISEQPKQTPLYNKHIEASAKMVDFAGWQMPMNYGSQVQEHHQVRNDAGMFDVSHMVVLDFEGKDVTPFLQYLLANDVNKLKDSGKALYSAMLNDHGGIIDDLIVYYLSNGLYRMVVNAATRDKNLEWINKQLSDSSLDFDVEFTERDDLSMIAVQGPNAREKVHQVLKHEEVELVSNLKPFFGSEVGKLFIARTGYTGEDGYEILVPSKDVISLWDKLLEAGVEPIGLGARDTLRLEAGMNLYGTDMDESINPLSAAMGWTIAWEPLDRNFIGREALEQSKAKGLKYKLVGLVLEDKGVLRGQQEVITEFGNGVVTSGSFSPTLGFSIAFARIPVEANGYCHVNIRNKKLSAKIVKTQFVRNGKAI